MVLTKRVLWREKRAVPFGCRDDGGSARFRARDALVLSPGLFAVDGHFSYESSGANRPGV